MPTDPMAIFSTAREAEHSASKLLELEKQRAVVGQYRKWIEE